MDASLQVQGSIHDGILIIQFWTGVQKTGYISNRDPNVTDDSGTPEWQVTIFPDQDDPYAFHYFGTFNWTMAGIHMFGRYVAFEGDPEPDSCFSLLIAVY